ncbi:MAG: homoserine dehydrogenase [Nitrososphaerota archaeon]
MIKALILGYGFLGKSLIKRLIIEPVPGLLIVGIANSKGYIFSSEGIKLKDLKDKLEENKEFETGRASDLISKDYVDLLIELTPTNITTGEPGLSHVKKAITQGIDVVTANKGPVVLALNELKKMADENGVIFRYEGTVGGGIPIFSLIDKCLRGDKVISIRGILNGTTNYILTRMHFEGLTFELALREAMMLGIAERNPTLDVEGIDTAIKIVILANSIIGLNKKLSDVKIRGITKITPEAISAAKENGMTIKLIGSIEDGELSVEPRLIRLNHPLCVHGTLNAINIRTSILKNLTLIGEGAGESTIASIINDIYDVITHKSASI